MDCQTCHQPLIKTPVLSKASLTNLLQSCINEQNLPAMNLCNDCLSELSNECNLRFEKASEILSSLYQEQVGSEGQEQNATTRDNALRKQEEDIEGLQKENQELYQNIMAELLEVLALEEEAAEFEYKNSQAMDDLEKEHNELQLLKFKGEIYQKLEPLQTIFEIELQPSYGIIRNFEIQFPIAANFALEQTWVEVNEGIGAMLWLISTLFDAIRMKISEVGVGEYDIFVMGSCSQISYKKKGLFMYGPFEDAEHQEGFNEGISKVIYLCETLFEELVKRKVTLTNPQILPKRLPAQMGRSVRINFGSVKKWEFAIRNILENLKCVMEIIPQIDYEKLKQWELEQKEKERKEKEKEKSSLLKQ